MAGNSRASSGALERVGQLRQEPYRFDLLAALRLIETLYPDKPRLGYAARPADDPIRLGQQPSLAFAPSTIAGFEDGGEGRPARLEILSFGLFGPNGPLPLHLTEYARERQRNAGDATFARFADIFHHRMLAFFYRAWASARPAVQFDRPESDRFGCYVGSLFGMGASSVRARDSVPDAAKFHYAGRLVCQNRNAEGLLAMLQDFFGMRFELEQFVGHWLQIPEHSRCRLGESRVTGSLGQSVTLGAKVWDCQSKFRIVCGPLGLLDYRRLLPGRSGLTRLVDLVRNYIGDELDWDLRLVLKRDEVPALRLGEDSPLGWTSWLGSRTVDEDADDLLLNPAPYVTGSAA